MSPERASWTIIAIAISVAVIVWSVALIMEAKTVEVPPTVERRIHLSIKGQWDSDKARKFECREVK